MDERETGEQRIGESQTPPSCLVSLRRVSVRYGECGALALEEVSLEVAAGEVVVLCGESGCGKTTLTRLVNGLVPQYYEGEVSGSVSVGGCDVSRLELHELALMVGSVFQNPRSRFFNVDVESELAFGRENAGLPVDGIRRRVHQVAADFDLHEMLHTSIFQLSGGQKQKVACASVAVDGPPVMVLDEPTSNLDIAAIHEVRQLIGRWKAEGKAVLIAEHRLSFLHGLADRFVYLRDGRVEQTLRAAEFEALSLQDLRQMGLRAAVATQFSHHVTSARERRGFLEIRGLSFRYRRAAKPALEVDHLLLDQGRIVAVVGSNGAGKTTLARCLCGLEKAARGEVRLDGKIRGTAQRLRCCYMVMQDVNHQLFTESVLDEVLLSMAEPDESRAASLLGSLDLLAVGDAHPLSLSGGQKQRVALASALASERDVIVFDEPTSGLDVRHMKEVAHSLQALSRLGKTQLVITHDPELIAACCDWIVFVDDGRIAWSGGWSDQNSLRMAEFFSREI